MYNVTFLLSASDAEQKMLLTWPSEDLSSHGMVVGIVSLMLSALRPSGTQWNFGALALVIWIPVRERFILPFEVADDTGRYFCTLSALMKGHPLSW